MDAVSVTGISGDKKRPPKGFRACWECKRRKTQDASGQILASPSPCPFNGFSLEKAEDDNTCSRHLSERLAKLEQLFERFVCRKAPSFGVFPEPPGSPMSMNSTEKVSKFPNLPEIPSDTQSISSIGQGILGAQQWSSAPSIRTLVDSGDGSQYSGNDSVRRSLVALLPTQHDADIIFESSNGWMLLKAKYKPAHNLYANKDPESYALDMSSVAQESSIIVARTLLHMAICINSLPPEFDASRLSNIWSLDATMQNYVNTVTSLVTSSDEQMSTLHGLETLLLLALYHMDSANLRQAWLIIRRALSLAHLMGFHRIIANNEMKAPIEAVEAAKWIWRTLVDMDRYLGLHLRLPFAADDYPIPAEADLHLIHRSKICSIARQLSEFDHEITPQSYSRALALDENLEKMMKELPKDFWDVPNIPPTAKTTESQAVLERLIVQMWHFELKIFLHLPFLLRAPEDSRYGYSKVTALQASRNVVMRWFALRNASITQACCRFAEMGVFIAAVTLALDILIEMATKEKSEVKKTKGSDFAMVCRLIGEMEKLAQSSTREKIAARSVVVLKKILGSLDPSRQHAGKARLTVPYFGTIEVDFKKLPRRPLFDVDSDTAKKLNVSTAGHRFPVFSFVSNSLWPSAGANECCTMDFDIILFDGLEDKDLEGNWVF